MKKILSFALLCFSLCFSVAHAQSKISSGVKDGTYYTMVNQIIAMCGTDGSIVNVEQKNGSPGTIGDMVNNQAAGGFVQFDVLWDRSRHQNLTDIKTLLPMHRETVHLLVLTKPLMMGGYMGTSYGAKEIVLRDSSNLQNLNVGSQGGSAATARVINQASTVKFNLVEGFGTPQDLINALDAGKVQAALLVGGAPMKLIAELPKGKYRLLPFDAKTIEELKGIYNPELAYYQNLQNEGVKSLSVDALFVVRNYESTKMSTMLNKLRDCIKSNYVDLKEGDNSHPAWATVNFKSTEKPRWDVYVGKQ